MQVHCSDIFRSRLLVIVEPEASGRTSALALHRVGRQKESRGHEISFLFFRHLFCKLAGISSTSSVSWFLHLCSWVWNTSELSRIGAVCGSDNLALMSPVAPAAQRPCPLQCSHSSSVWVLCTQFAELWTGHQTKQPIGSLATDPTSYRTLLYQLFFFPEIVPSSWTFCSTFSTKHICMPCSYYLHVFAGACYNLCRLYCTFVW